MPIRNRNLMMALAIGALVAGCAGNVERPTAELTRARTLVDQAEQAGAQRYAAAELEQARDKLRQADAMAEEGEAEEARQLAVEAALDAELATARTTSSEAQRAAREIERSVEVLRQEAGRTVPAASPGSDVTRPSGTLPPVGEPDTTR